MEEIWKPVIGYEKLYEVSNMGNVRIICGKNCGKLFKLQKQRYYTVCLTRKGIGKTVFVHRLVANAFIPNPHNKPCIDHIDTNPFNNKVSNLRWVTHSENSNNPLTRLHISDGKAGKHREKYIMSEERKKNISLAKSKPVICLSKEGKFIKEFLTIKDAASFANVSVFAIYHSIDGQSKSSGGYKWKFKD